MRLMHWATRIFGTFLVLLALYTIYMYFQPTSQTGFGPLRGGRGLSNPNGVLAICAGGVAVAIWVARKIYVEMKKAQHPNFEISRHAALFLRKHHILFGWIALLTATAHGMYYLVVYTSRRYDVITGWLAWGSLFVLSGLGIFFDNRLAEKKKVKSMRLYHIGFAVLFVVTALVHLF